MNKKMNQTEKKELALLLKKAVKLKLINEKKALYKHLFLAIQDGSKTQKKTLVSYIDKLEHVILNKTTIDKGNFKSLKVVAPRYVTVEVTVTDGQEAYKTTKPVEGGWRPDLGNFTKPYELNNGNPLRFNINNIVRRTDVPIATQIKDIMISGGRLDGTKGNWFFEQENKVRSLARRYSACAAAPPPLQRRRLAAARQDRRRGRWERRSGGPRRRLSWRRRRGARA